ncbi:CopG family transcriptional regulator [Bellilinea sp.]|uniref:CopG family transcriptional regulator n=1 Tax=Bellilinea caldifistulae TaxID=360411 RepID=A0A7C4L2E7_9CHLR
MPEPEKVTINLSVVDLGQIDVLVEEGYYSSRTDFLRTAARAQLEKQSEALNQIVRRRGLTIGVVHLNRAELEEHFQKGESLDVRVVGMLAIDAEVPPQLAGAVIRNLQVYGVVRATRAVRAALGIKERRSPAD